MWKMFGYLASSDSSSITDRIRAFFRSCQTGTFGSAVYGTRNTGFTVFGHRGYLLQFHGKTDIGSRTCGALSIFHGARKSR